MSDFRPLRELCLKPGENFRHDRLPFSYKTALNRISLGRFPAGVRLLRLPVNGRVLASVDDVKALWDDSEVAGLDVARIKR
jgi:hypothetical protein